MSTRYLTPWQLEAIKENAEFGELDHTTVSKRHVRILTSLHFVLSRNDDLCTLPYASLQTIQNLVERFFGKKYDTSQIRYWMEDLLKRGYIAEYDEDEEFEKNFFSLTEHGIKLFAFLYETREALFESNSKNSLAFLN